MSSSWIAPALALAVAAGGRGWAGIEARWLSVTHHPLAAAGLARAWDGVRLAHVSDLHVRGWGPVERHVVDAVKRVNPELVLFTGDYLEDPHGQAALQRLLGEIVPGRRAYAVLGDNDVAERAGVADVLKRHGVELLHNRAVPLEKGGARLWLAGVGDPHTGGDDLPAALRYVAGAEPVVLLAHSPEIAPALEESASAHRVALTLTGHTHGGQICLPFYGAIYTHARTGLKYRSGRYRLGGGTLYVSRGLGTSRLQARLFCRPELAFFELRSS